MSANRTNSSQWFGFAVMSVACLIQAAPAKGVTLHQPGYVVTPLVAVPTSYYSPSDIELDGSGRLYVPAQPNGIYQITPEGAIANWSSAPAIDMTLGPNGSGFGAGRALCNCILTIQSDGSFATLHADAFEWTYVKQSPSGELYANIWAGPGQGLYRIDRTTGAPTLLVAGGPGPGGAGWYWDMCFGLDGQLYTLGYDGAAYALLRLSGSTFTRVATLPHAGIGLTRDEQGLFYTATSFNDLGEVWIIDPLAGTSTLLASQLAWPASVAYDSDRGRLYVSEQLGQRNIYFISKGGVTASRRVAWGMLKARYR